MDEIVLRLVTRELERALTGQPLGDVVQLDACRFLLRFDAPPFPRLHVGLHPSLSTLHLAGSSRAPAAPTELAASLTQELRGRPLASIEKPPAERLVMLRFEDDRSLVIELMGSASNLLLLDGSGRILRSARSPRGIHPRVAVGAVYQPPPPRPGPAPTALERSELEAIALSSPRDLAAALVARSPGLSPRLAREVEHLTREGRDVWEVWSALHRRVREGPYAPVLYAPERPDTLEEATTLDAHNLFAFVFPLEHASRLVATPAASANEAVAAATHPMLRHLAYSSFRASLAALLGDECRRNKALIDTLDREAEEARRAAPRDRRRGELILASLTTARKESGVVRVVDHYDPEGRIVEIPVDGRLDLRANAERYFRNARRAERALAIVPARLSRQQERGVALQAAVERLGETRTRVALETLERSLQQEGLIRALRQQQRPEVGAKPKYVKVRSYQSSDGFAILVGRSGTENDTLTFKVAAPHDLWLHAAGYPGAHVIVRNPGRLREIPESTIEEAAGLAAWFSRAQTEGPLDVHVAWRRHVRKGKGMSPGMVMLKRHRTVRVAPVAPRGSATAH